MGFSCWYCVEAIFLGQELNMSQRSSRVTDENLYMGSAVPFDALVAWIPETPLRAIAMLWYVLDSRPIFLRQMPANQAGTITSLAPLRRRN